MVVIKLIIHMTFLQYSSRYGKTSMQQKVDLEMIFLLTNFLLHKKLRI